MRKLLITRRRISWFSGGTKAEFEMFYDGETLPEGLVCLSRNKPGSCNFALGDLTHHDGHSPLFKSEEEMDVYINRVVADIEGLLEEEVEKLVSYRNYPSEGTVVGEEEAPPTTKKKKKKSKAKVTPLFEELEESEDDGE